jgi:hypothetical protein
MLRQYPRPPDLQELVERFGGYEKISPEAWAEFAAAMAEWDIERRMWTCGLYYNGRKPK